MKTMCSFRLSSESVSILSDLQSAYPGLSQADLVEISLKYLSELRGCWNASSKVVGFGPFDPLSLHQQHELLDLVYENF